MAVVRIMLTQEKYKVRYTRITAAPNQMNGLLCIRGLRIPVATIIGLLAVGMAEVEI
jgi:uncharacterized protein (DUF433 family)